MKGISGSVFTLFPLLYPVRKLLIVFRQFFFNLPGMRYFFTVSHSGGNLSTHSPPTCMSEHIFSSRACSYSLHLSPFKCVRPPTAGSLFTAPWVSRPVTMLCSLQHQRGTGDKNYYMRLQPLLTVVDRPNQGLDWRRSLHSSAGRDVKWRGGVNKIPEKT